VAIDEAVSFDCGEGARFKGHDRVNGGPWSMGMNHSPEPKQSGKLFEVEAMTIIAMTCNMDGMDNTM
jgi:hypothetical protein